MIRVVDIETTGLPEDEGAAICEIGWWDVHLDPIEARSPFWTYVDPGHPIPAKTRAVHHISDDDVRGRIQPDAAVALLTADMDPDDILCAHNDRFERHFIASDRRWIDTYRCALRAWPDAPGHGNQVLRYVLGFDDRPGFVIAEAMPPHRAAPDAYVTAWILMELLSLRPVERLVDISQQPGLLPKLTFGKHRGLKFADAPIDYLEWMARQTDMDPDAKFTAQHWIKRRVAA